MIPQIASCNREQVQRICLLLRIRVQCVERQQFGLGGVEPRRLNQVFRKAQANVDRAIGPGCQVLLRQKS